MPSVQISSMLVGNGRNQVDIRAGVIFSLLPLLIPAGQHYLVDVFNPSEKSI